MLVWRVDCSSPSSISLVRLALPPGNSVVDTGFYTSEFLSLLIEGDAQQEGQTLTHLPLVSLTPFMVSSSASGSLNCPTYQVNYNPYQLGNHLLDNSSNYDQVEEVTGGRSRLLESLPARGFATSGPRKVG